MTSVFKIQNKLEYFTKVGEKKKVASVTLDLTQNCNSGCLFCFKENNKKKENELGTNDVYKIIDKLYRDGCYMLQITGGEPFIRSDIFDIIRYAKKKHFFVMVNTNGSLLNKEKIKELSLIKPDTIIFSMHSVVEKTYKKIMKCNVSLSKIIENIIAVKNVGINVHLNAVLTKYNIDEFSNLKKFWERYGIESIRGEFANSSHNESNLTDSFYPSKEQLFNYFKLTKMPLPNFNYDKNKRLCGAGINGFHINSDGKVVPCLSLNVEIGDIRVDSLSKIMNHHFMEKLRNIRIQNLEKCDRCGNQKYCKICVGENYMENKTLFKSSKLSCLKANMYSDYFKVISGFIKNG
ncbi:MAG: hypothetical protein CR982_01905 [Candidatus Cloacimonadota bacterium]|nr:MAG: hypothetical protein CR982_01905 [Candidatus Cloacimonadota bacterium]PIE78898.1 MAG: hypothetical protein CSA15_05450 [Candidatus Delongbacteria bacterium]